jgi:class 3 adenylate cyclase/tetratricopeptide (TPR) repeat protein
MKCPRCEQENPPQAKFCLECATALALRCSNCGTQLPAGAKFCFECATPVTAHGSPRRPTSPDAYTPKHLAERIRNSKAALEGERKQVTVLFADLKGSMELLADRDPEEARKLLDPVLGHMMDAVHRYEGTVNQVMGDGIMALFGAPLAHEDHAVRACYAALRMQEAVRRYSDELRHTQGVEVQIRVGLNSGEVVVRSIGSDLRMDYTAVGQTTHLAARMEQLATPGTVRLTGETLRLAEGYVEVRSLGPIPVKGLSDPIEIFELTGAGQARTRLQAAALRGLTRFVGRDAEVEHLRRVLGQAGVGHGQVAAIVGEAGVGKSRLTYEFTHSHRVQDWLILEASSVSYGKATSYLPVIDLLKGYFKIGDRDSHREMRDKVMGRVLGLDRALEPLLSPLLTLLDVPVDDAAWQTLDAPQRRQRTLDAVKRLLLRESQVQPLLVVFEDLHWIDSETQTFLDALVESLPAAQLLLLVNYRPEYEHAWGGRTYYTQLRIDPLSAESAEDLLEALLGVDAALKPLKQLLTERTEGNPFFLEESIRTLVETEVLVGDRGAYRLARRVEGLQVPATVQAVLAARIDRLPPDEKGLLQTAAAIGVDVPFAVLQAIAATSEETLRRVLGHLQAAELLYEAALFPDLEYRFKHALTHEVAYGSLLRERRRELHGAVGHALEELYAERQTEHSDKLAHHFMRAEEWDRGVRYSLLAGQRAEDAYASAEAASHYRRGLDAARRVNPPLEVASMADLHRRYAGALAALTEYDASIAECQRALELVRHIGDRTREAAILADMSVALGRDHRAEQAVEFNEQSMTAARDLGNQRLEAVCLVQRARLRSVWHGDLGPAMADAEAALRLSASVGDARLHANIAAAMGTFLQWRGQYAEALGLLRECARLGEEQRDAGVFASASYFVITACTSRGEYEEALTCYRRLSDYAFSAQDKFWMARVPNLEGGIHLELFDLDTAIRLNLEGEEIARKVYRWPEPRGHCLLKTGLAYLQQGEIGRATELFGRARAFLADDRWLRWRWEIPLLRAEAELALAQGQPDDAWRQATESLTLATRTGSRKHVARAHTAQGEILAASGRLDEAATAFESSIALAKEMGTPREHWIAQAALGRTFYRLGRDEAAEAAYDQAARIIDALVATLTTPRLRHSFLAAEPVLEVYRALGRRSPLEGT